MFQGPWMLRSLSYGREVLHARLLLEFWEPEEGFKLYSSNHNKLCGLYDGAKEAEADAGVGGINGRYGQGES